MTHFQNIWLKEYADVPWAGLLVLFVIASLPFFIKGLSKSSIFTLQGYNLLVSIVIPAILRPTTALSLGIDNFMTAFFLAFGIGYSLLCIRKEKANRAEDWDSTFSIISLIFFLGLTFLIVLNNLKFF
ncbi:MAG TPA: hypothetical protein DCZ94_15915 [Lentisphaeria bacterium]|nr:MAG: hypothetical protein A2X48_00300 [Lentisphaerae bacterium GWF2_49_21]HBC88435.1 hypothetical protein [Lentisphaeria bacterium]